VRPGGTGHPLPASGEARHREIPEGLEDRKGRGDDSQAIISPDPEAVDPDGEPYRYEDLGRGPSGQGGPAEPRDAGEAEI
jgi:hypothetical protein